MAKCAKCDAVFCNKLQLGAHVKICTTQIITQPFSPTPIKLNELASREEAPWGRSTKPALPFTSHNVRRLTFTRDYREVCSVNVYRCILLYI